MSDSSMYTLAELAEGAFNAYGEHCGWKTFDGRDMPRWADVNDAVRSHWVAATEWLENAFTDMANAQVTISKDDVS